MEKKLLLATEGSVILRKKLSGKAEGSDTQGYRREDGKAIAERLIVTRSEIGGRE